jgi:hypothetical protein
LATDSLPEATTSAILNRVISPDRPDLTPDAARAVLAWEFDPEDKDRMHALGEKARAGTLTPAEDEALENYLRVGHLLALLKSKARKALRDIEPRRS